LQQQGLIDITVSVGAWWEDVWLALHHHGVRWSRANGGKVEAMRRATEAWTTPYYLLYGDVWPRYQARDLLAAYRPGYGVVGRSGAFLDTGLSLLEPRMQSFTTINVPMSLDIGSPEGYAETCAHFQEGTS